MTFISRKPWKHAKRQKKASRLLLIYSILIKSNGVHLSKPMKTETQEVDQVDNSQVEETEEIEEGEIDEAADSEKKNDAEDIDE